MARNKPDLAPYKVLAREIDSGITMAEGRLSELRAQRERLMVVMRQNGCTYDQIGEVLGVTRNRVWQKLKAV